MDTVTVTAVVGTGVTVVGAAAIVARHMRQMTREVTRWREDWYGEKARPGFPAVPGVPERLERIEYQMSSNGGGSMKDQLGRVELNQSRQAVDHGILVRRFDAYASQMAPVIAEINEWQRWRNAVPASDEADQARPPRQVNDRSRQ